MPPSNPNELPIATHIYKQYPESVEILFQEVDDKKIWKSLTSEQREDFHEQYPNHPEEQIKGAYKTRKRGMAASSALATLKDATRRTIERIRSTEGSAGNDLIAFTRQAAAGPIRDLTNKSNARARRWNNLAPSINDFRTDLANYIRDNNLTKEVASRTGMYPPEPTPTPEPITTPERATTTVQMSPAQVASVRSPDSDLHHPHTPTGSAPASRASSSPAPRQRHSQSR